MKILSSVVYASTRSMQMCPVCSEPVPDGNVKFCSKTCSNKGSGSRTATCLDCQIEFECGSRGVKPKRCPVCRPKHGQAWERQYHSERYLKLKEKYKFKARRHWLSQYGLTPEEYADMVESQHGVCAICGKESTPQTRTGSRPRQLAVDHDHESGKVRGLLCSRCNLCIGQLDHDVELLRRAIEYLEEYSD